MERIDTDVLVAGAGPAGLAAACLFAAEGLAVLCIDAAAPPVEGPGADLRTAALLRPSVEALERSGAWRHLEAEAAPLWTMRLIDAGGPEEPPVARETADFVATEIQELPFGWNLPNVTIRQGLLARLGEFARARLRMSSGLVRLTCRETEAVALLADGTSVRARLVVAADGRDSEARRLAGMEARRWGYGQKAIVFAVSHPLPHEGVSTEIHRTGGPFTLVPLPDGPDGTHRSAVVWMDRGPWVERLAGWARARAAEFDTALNDRSCGVLGRLTLASPVAVWPIVSQLAPRLDGPRVALMGEAAHVVPPIGAQGLNMSIADAAALAGMVGEAARAGADIGAPALLARYHRARWPEMAARVAGVDALNRAAMAEAQTLRDLRRRGLETLHRLRPVRRAAMRLGMGAR